VEIKMKCSITAGLAAVTLIAGASGAWAQAYHSTQPYAPYYPLREQLPVQVQQQLEYDRSGTIGRMGLGASPYHPEGPGNVTTPAR
jgi:hypothetical protein